MSEWMIVQRALLDGKVSEPRDFRSPPSPPLKLWGVVVAFFCWSEQDALQRLGPLAKGWLG